MFLIDRGPGPVSCDPRRLAEREGFSPLQLFASGAPGVWFDPSDLATLYQDATGTIPVTQPGQPVGLMLDKSKGLVRGPEAWTAGMSAAWAVSGTVVSNDDHGRLVLSFAGTNNYGYRGFSVKPNQCYLLEIDTFSEGNAACNYYVSSNALNGSHLSLIGKRDENLRAVFFSGSQTLLYLGIAATSGAVVRAFSRFSITALPGYHATQPVAAARPTLARQPKGGRRNLALPYGSWTHPGTTVTPMPEIADPFGNFGTVYRVQMAATSATYLSFYSNQGASGPFVSSAYVRRHSGPSDFAMFVGGSIAPASATRFSATEEWVRYSSPETGSGTGFNGINNTNDTYGVDVLVCYPQVEVGSVMTPVQVVNGQYDVTEAGMPDCWHLSDDLVDDALPWTAPAGAYTLASLGAGGVTILGDQALSGSTDLLGSARVGGYLAIARALSSWEAAKLTAHFDAMGAL